VTDEPNPYASPQAESTAASPFSVSPQGNIDPALLGKIEAIIKDAGQFWMAILLCFLCSGVGFVLIGPWYAVRLLQWNSIAQAQPMLLDPNAPRGSLAQKFRSAKTKLIIAMSFGAVILLAVMAFIALPFLLVRGI